MYCFKEFENKDNAFAFMRELKERKLEFEVTFGVDWEDGNQREYIEIMWIED